MALIKLNFLPHRLLTQTRRRQRLYQALCASLGFGAASVAVTDMQLDLQLSQQAALVQVLKNEHGKLDARQRALNALKQQAADLAQRQQELNELLRQQHLAPALLQTLAQQTPPEVSLRTLKQHKTGITLSGNAASPEDVILLLTNLQEHNDALAHAKLLEVHVDQENANYRFVIQAEAQTSAPSDL